MAFFFDILVVFFGHPGEKAAPAQTDTPNWRVLHLRTSSEFAVPKPFAESRFAHWNKPRSVESAREAKPHNYKRPNLNQCGICMSY